MSRRPRGLPTARPSRHGSRTRTFSIALWRSPANSREGAVAGWFAVSRSPWRSSRPMRSSRGPLPWRGRAWRSRTASTRSRWATVGVRGHRRRPRPHRTSPCASSAAKRTAGRSRTRAMTTLRRCARPPLRLRHRTSPPGTRSRRRVGRARSRSARARKLRKRSRSSPTATPSSTLSTTRRPGRSSTRRCSSTATRARRPRRRQGSSSRPSAASSRRAAARGSASSSRGEAARR